MKVFLCWSGGRSRAVAEALKDWLPDAVPGVDPLLSVDIEKGARWSAEVAKELEESKVGVICLTPERPDRGRVRARGEAPLPEGPAPVGGLQAVERVPHAGSLSRGASLVQRRHPGDGRHRPGGTPRRRARDRDRPRGAAGGGGGGRGGGGRDRPADPRGLRGRGSAGRGPAPGPGPGGHGWPGRRVGPRVPPGPLLARASGRELRSRRAQPGPPVRDLGPEAHRPRRRIRRTRRLPRGRGARDGPARRPTPRLPALEPHEPGRGHARRRPGPGPTGGPWPPPGARSGR